jgi:predicted DNA-binding protein
MSKPQKFGPSMGVRLPIETYDAVRILARAEGTPLAVYVRERFLEHPVVSTGVDKGVEPVESYAAQAAANDRRRLGERDERARIQSGGCAHLSQKSIGSVEICADCGAIHRNGAWGPSRR